jgi:hypothetical protein
VTARLVQQLSLLVPQLLIPGPPGAQLRGTTVPLSPPPLDEPDEEPEPLPLLEPELLPDPELLPEPDPLPEDEEVAS